MKVLKKGREQKGWSTEATCTGLGNGGGGCRAELLVEEGDLFQTSHQSYGDTSPDYYVTFRCSECGVLTDIKNYPKPARDLPRDPQKRGHDARDLRASQGSTTSRRPPCDRCKEERTHVDD